MHKVLVIGSGGRESSIVWALSRSFDVEAIYCAPGNPGIEKYATCVPIAANDINKLVTYATEMKFDLVVIGPEVPLVLGLADRLREAGIPVFGPNAAAAEIEGSKIFAKKFMVRHRIPTAPFRIIISQQQADDFFRSHDIPYPVIVKADGLCAGKGVVRCEGESHAREIAQAMLSGTRHGDAGKRIIIEDCLVGREASFFVLTDGKEMIPLAVCQDYKPIHDGNQDDNTGGMGGFSPSLFLDVETQRFVMERIIRPAINGLMLEGRPYQGVLYVGLMLTDDGPKVIEFNARFGDPETQLLMPRLDGDWFPLFHACATNNLTGMLVSWKKQAAVCVVMASGRYPDGGDTADENKVITGIDRVMSLPDVFVFHAGTKRTDQESIVAAGGRVLNVVALGSDINDARTRAYQGVDLISWDGEQHRTDIALDAL